MRVSPNGLNLFFVESLLGHSSMTMTRVYADQVSSEDAIKAYKPIMTYPVAGYSQF